MKITAPQTSSLSFKKIYFYRVLKRFWSQTYKTLFFVTVHGAVTLGIMTLSTKTFDTVLLIVMYAERRYAECRYTECRGTPPVPYYRVGQCKALHSGRLLQALN
jgi:hypothetical protein